MSFRLVVGQGAVDVWCDEHDFIIRDWIDNDTDPGDYKGRLNIIVTDHEYSKNEYYHKKLNLLRRGIELISTHWYDADLEDFVYDVARREQRREYHGGRQPYGYRMVNGERICVPEEMECVDRIFALRDAGATYREIVTKVKRADGRDFAISTVQVILNNRSKYNK